MLAALAIISELNPNLLGHPVEDIDLVVCPTGDFNERTMQINELEAIVVPNLAFFL